MSHRLKGAMTVDSIPQIPPGYNRCSSCHREFPATLEFFHHHRGHKDGLNSWCKQCAIIISRQYYRENADKIKARSNQYRLDNFEKIQEKKKRYSQTEGAKAKSRARNAKYQQKNAARLREKQKQWLIDHPENRRKASKKYYQNNKEQYRLGVINRRARLRQDGGVITAADIEKQHHAQKGRCYYCGIKVGDNYHVDHVIPVTRGGSNTPDNIVISCPKCNRSKSD